MKKRISRKDRNRLSFNVNDFSLNSCILKYDNTIKSNGYIIFRL